MRGACDAPVLAMPNAGPPRWDDGRAVYDLGPEAFADGMRVVLEAGASLVGGCCGTTPAHIAALRRSLGV
jgi:5-methyltetrahydrofolate--homocysteine methyltransferase